MECINKNNNKFVITTPLYYVNDVPHIGSAYTTIAADVVARFHRLCGDKALLITGTDEHGLKIQRTANNRGLDPQAHCDEIVEGYRHLWEILDINYDRFSRTTDPRHHQIVQEFFGRVWQKGDIYLSQQKGWYCVACEEFKEERELLENKHCTTHSNQIAEWRDEANYFFRLSKYQEQLEKLYQEQPEFIGPESRRNEVISFVKQGLKDFSISRVNLDWGFPIPNDPQHTIYVWFDALLGYVTALLEPDEEATLVNALAKWWPINLHLIGKDILRFHAIYWPAMLLSADIALPKQIFGHGFLTKDGQKMGKSLGNTLNPFDLVSRFGADAVRYYFTKEVELGKDGDFNEERFVNIVNADLANDLGNLLNRTLGMIHKYCKGGLPKITKDDIQSDNRLLLLGTNLGTQVIKDYQDLQLNLACEKIFNLISNSNKFIDESAPWSLYKQGEQRQVEQILYVVIESVRLCAYLLSPIITNTSSKIYQQLGFSVNFKDMNNLNEYVPFAIHSQWGVVPLNSNLSKPVPVFTKLELFPIDN
jgi:methionyl-tRNA synthetase